MFFKIVAKTVNIRKNYLGKKCLFGNLVGYNEHHKFFGDKLKATSDGRYSGDMINYGGVFERFGSWQCKA